MKATFIPCTEHAHAYGCMADHHDDKPFREGKFVSSDNLTELDACCIYTPVTPYTVTLER